MDSDDYKVELVKGLSTAWGVARSDIKKAQCYQKKQYDKRAKSVVYRERDKVMVFMPLEVTGKDRKLATVWWRWGLTVFWYDQWTNQVTNQYSLAWRV